MHVRFLLLPLIFLLSSAGSYKFFSEQLQHSTDYQYMNFESQGQHLEMAYIYKRPIVPNGKTVVLLHGKNFSAAYWEQTIQYLNNKGYAVLAPDQVGFGRSSQPLSYQFSFQQLAENTRLLMDTLHIDKAVILGHSMGGMLATRLALMYPTYCSQLLLENPIGLEDWKLQVPYNSVDQENIKEMEQTREKMKDYMMKNYFHDTWEARYDTLLDDYDHLIKGKHAAAYAKNMALTTDMIFTQPVCYEFKKLSMPVGLIIGQKDRTAIGKERANADAANRLGNYPALGKKTAADIKNCCLYELQGIGHVPHVEDFKRFAETLDLALDRDLVVK